MCRAQCYAVARSMSAPQSFSPVDSTPRRIAGRLHAKLVATLWDPQQQSRGLPRRWLIRVLQVFYVSIRELVRGQLTLRAMSLVYTTLLSLVPIFVVTFSLIKAFGATRQVDPALAGFLSPLGERGIELAVTIVSFVNNVDVGVVGLLGVLLLVYTVISLAQKIEAALNYVWRVGRPRTVAGRFVNHISFLLVAPLLVVGGMLLEQQLQQLPLSPTASAVVGGLVPYLLLAAAFALIYYWMPNTRVKMSAAALGGAVAALLWQFTAWLFSSTISTSSRYAILYSGLAAGILALIWLYLNWIILLLGAQIAFLRQNPRYLTVSPTRLELSNRLKERIALSVMYLVGYNYYHRLPAWTVEGLVGELQLPNAPVFYVVAFLQNAQMIAQTADQPPRYVPARSLETIEVRDLWKDIREAEETPFLHYEGLVPMPVVDGFFGQAIIAARDALGETTLRDLVAAGPSAPPAQPEP
jgi:membrane protein